VRVQPSLIPVQASRAFELYRWGGRFLHKGRADHVTRRRVEAQETGFDTITGDSGNRRLHPAQRFTLQGHPLAGENGDYTVVSVMHQASDPTYAGGPGGEAPSYSNSFTVIPADCPFVPQQRTPRPRIEGVQTATVVGPPGEEIFIDQFGRIQVAFHWDRYARGRDGDSCWIQVCQPSSGDGHGIQIKPRIGMTALITYFEGDPDKPLCIGTAPNPDNPVSYDFPANKSRSTWRSLSHKAKGYTGNNEISMEDDAGRENLFFHAQRDHTTKVRNNQVQRVGGDRAESIGAGQAITVGGNHKEEIGGSMNLTVGGVGAAAAALAGGLGASSAGLIDQAAGIADGAGGGSPLLGDFAGIVGGSALGFLAGPALGAQQGMAAGPSSRTDAGAALAGAGGGLGAAVGKLFPMAGIMNTVVGALKSDTVGVASHEQVGIAKTTNVGQAYVVNVGTELRITVGESSLTMKKDGTVILKGVKFYFEADTHIQATSKIIDLN
jgi:type VI secretion system secreted protein VgrG